MSPQEFCHWLQGFFDGLNSPQELNEMQTHLMKEKLKRVVNAPRLYEWKAEAFSDQKHWSETMEKIKKEAEWNKTVEQIKKPLSTDEENFDWPNQPDSK